MGPRLTYRAYRESNHDNALNALSAVCERVGHSIDLSRDYIRERLSPVKHQGFLEELEAQEIALVDIGFAEKAFTLHMSYLGGVDFRIAEAVGIELDCPWFELRIQEGNHWDYSFYKGGDLLDQFSAEPWYFGESPRKTRGKPDLIEKEWGVARKSVSGYLKHWRWFRRGKAYPNDEASYREYEQLFDFMRALEVPFADDHSYAFDASEKNS